MKNPLAIAFMGLVLCIGTSQAAKPADVTVEADAPKQVRPDPCAEPKRDPKKSANKKAPATKAPATDKAR